MRYFNLNTIYLVIILSFVWLLLTESFTLPLMAASIVISVCCIFFCYSLLPEYKKLNFKLFRLIIYFLYLFGQMYIAAFKAIVFIIKGAEVNIIEVKTQISDVFLRTVLAKSITLTPGSISLELKNDMIMVLLLDNKKLNKLESENKANSINNSLEKILIKAEK